METEISVNGKFVIPLMETKMETKNYKEQKRKKNCHGNW